MEKKECCSEKLDTNEVKKGDPQPKCDGKSQKWEKPTLEDVSGKVMAQPYIRFT